MQQVKYLIIGGGIAGTSAAEAIRRNDPEGSITIITEESELLYSRIMLPDYLRDENTYEQLFMRKAEDYQNKKINLILNSRVDRVNSSSKTVHLVTGEEIQGEKLLIATGGKVNRLKISGGELPGVTYLRTNHDVRVIKDLMAKASESVVIGGGFIGIEFAQSFIKNKLKTTALIREKYFWENIVGENSGKLLSQLLTENGVEVLSEVQTAEFLGAGYLTGVKLTDEREIPAQIAGVGVGIHLDIEYLEGSGLKINKGILTNEYLETSVPNVWAAGDIAEFHDVLFNREHTLGNWTNASAQGRAVGQNMSGEKKVFETVSAYSIDIFETNFSFLGDPVADDKTEHIERGTVAEKKLARFLLRDDILVGASLINLPTEKGRVNSLIKNKTKLTANKAKLSDLSFNLTDLTALSG
jgi:NAD(P)H-nitrite reductase large subunit